MIGKAVNIARGKEVSINGIANIIIDKLNKGNLKPIYEKPRPGDVMRHYADVKKARDMFGYSAQIDIGQGIDKYIEWFTSQGYNYKMLLEQDMVFNW